MRVIGSALQRYMCGLVPLLGALAGGRLRGSSVICGSQTLWTYSSILSCRASIHTSISDHSLCVFVCHCEVILLVTLAPVNDLGCIRFGRRNLKRHQQPAPSASWTKSCKREDAKDAETKHNSCLLETDGCRRRVGQFGRMTAG